MHGSSGCARSEGRSSLRRNSTCSAFQTHPCLRALMRQTSLPTQPHRSPIRRWNGNRRTGFPGPVNRRPARASTCLATQQQHHHSCSRQLRRSSAAARPKPLQGAHRTYQHALGRLQTPVASMRPRPRLRPLPRRRWHRQSARRQRSAPRQRRRERAGPGRVRRPPSRRRLTTDRHRRQHRRS